MKEDLYNDGFIEEDIYQDEEYYENQEINYDFEDQDLMTENEDEQGGEYEEYEPDLRGSSKESYEDGQESLSDEDEESFNVYFPKIGENNERSFDFFAPEDDEDISSHPPEYEGDDYEPPGDGSFLTDIRDFLADWSKVGAVKKGALIFALCFFTFLYAFAGILGGRGHGPIGLLISMFDSHSVLGVFALIASLIISSMIAVVISLIIYQARKDKPTSFKRSKNDTYGDADWAKEMDLVDAIKFTSKDRPTDTVLGLSEDSSKSLSNDIRIGNRNVIVFGATGSGKDYTYLIPNILVDIDKGRSFIVIGPPRGRKIDDRTTYDLTSRLASKTHLTKILNLINLEASDGIDLLKVVKDARGTLRALSAADEFVNTIMRNAQGDVKEDYFDKIAKNLLQCLVNYVALSDNFAGEEYERVFGTCYQILVAIMANGGQFPLFDALPASDPAKTPWNIFSGSSPQQKASAMSGLETKIHTLQDALVQEVLGHDDIDLTILPKKPCAYYIETNVMNNRLNFILSVFFSSVIQTITNEVAKNPEQCVVDVNIYLNEFKALGQIAEFEDKLANVRKYGINIHIITQDIMQLEYNYPKRSTSIMANCDTLVLLGANDNKTAKEISDAIGETTIENETIRKEKAVVLPFSTALSENVSKTDGRRLLIPPAEIRRLRGEGRSIVLANSRKPYKARPYPYPTHFLAEYIGRSENQTDSRKHLPEWQKNEKNFDKYQTFLDPGVIDIAGTKIKEVLKEKKEGKEERNPSKPKTPLVPIGEDSKTLSMDLFDTYEQDI